MKRALLLLTGIILLSTTLSGQPKWRYYWLEAVVGGGASWYNTDIGNGRLVPVPAAGLRYKFHPSISVKFQLTAMKWKGNDAGTAETARGYAYDSWVFEPLLQAEYIVYRSKYDMRGYNVRGLDMDMRKTEAYLFSGLGWLYTNPVPSGDYVSDFPGDYDNISRVIPLGAGFRYNLNHKWTIQTEAGYRFSNSDFIEALKAGKHNDKHFLMLIQLSYRFKTSTSSSLNMKSI